MDETPPPKPNLDWVVIAVKPSTHEWLLKKAGQRKSFVPLLAGKILDMVIEEDLVDVEKGN